MRYYVIHNPRFDDNGFAYGEDFGNISLGPASKCEICGSSLTMKKWLPPYEIRVSRSRIGDFIYGTFANFMVSHKFKSLFESTDLRGIQVFHPVAVYFRQTPVDAQFFYPEIEMSNTHIDLEKSGFEFDGSRRCPSCQKGGSIIRSWKGIEFETPEETYLDVFNTKILGEKAIVSKRFHDFATEHQFSNLSMVHASKYSTPWSVS